MQITSISTYLVEVPVRRELMITSSLGTHSVTRLVLLRLETDAGYTGIGEATVAPRWSGETAWGAQAMIDRYLAPAVAGRRLENVADVTGALAAILAAAGLLVPSRLEPVERGWMHMAHAISKVTTPIFMAIVYFVVLTPAGWIRRTFGSNPLRHGADSGTCWVTREQRDPAALRRRMERQF